MKIISILIMIITLNIEIIGSEGRKSPTRFPLIIINQYEPILDNNPNKNMNPHIKYRDSTLFIATNGNSAYQYRNLKKDIEVRNHKENQLPANIEQCSELNSTTHTKNKARTPSRQYSRKKYTPNTQLPPIQEVNKTKRKK